MHRFQYVCDEIGAVTGNADMNDLLGRLEYHVENYLVRTYELRERAVLLAGAICADPALPRGLKNK